MPSKFLSQLRQSFKRGQKQDRSATPPTRSTVGIGSVIQGRYRLDGEIGRGGMGVVYRARDLVDNREVALKLLDASERNARVREQFLREAEITARLNHPHIVQVYQTGVVDAGDGASFPYLTMELLQGKSLADLRGLSYARITNIGMQICEALEYAHGQGLVHRDLKPENVLVEKHGREYTAKLVDFGLARMRATGTEGTNPPGAVLAEQGIAGTVYYLAPEVIAGQPADVAADLYSLGAVLYWMVTGRVPFSDMNESAILDQHLKQAVTPPSQSRADVPREMETLILRLLAKDPHDRPASAREVYETLKQIAQARQRNTKRNPPPQAWRLEGHAEMLTRIEQMFVDSRMVTIVGGDTANRTRLARAVAARVDAQFTDGTCVVELETCPEPRLAPQAVASALGVQGQPGRSLVVAIGDYLREKELLLVLNGCDRVSGACAQLGGMILQVCPDVSVLATSAEPLNVAEESVYRVSRQA